MEFIDQIMSTTIASFDFAFCVAVNVLTYISIKTVEAFKDNKPVPTWTKRVIMLVSVILVGVIYFLTGEDIKLLVNSAILAPVFWSWIAKPICNQFNIKYIKEDKDDEN